jgi:hypothetical protein
MDALDKLPDGMIDPVGVISKKFLELGINSFKKACEYVHNKDYGYNSNYEDRMIFFKENMGTCTTKHAVIAALAAELNIPVFKHVGIYKLTETISTGTNEILKKYELPYIPMVHCFLVYDNLRFDLTEGNCNGKNTSIEEFIHEERVDPFISRKDEYLLFKKVLRDKIMYSEGMKLSKERTILKAREEALKLLKENLKKQKNSLH